MINSILNFFRGTDYAALKEQGAVIIDVRTSAEYKQGHIQGSSNMPLGQIKKKAEKIKKLNKPVILCCATGMRSGQATSVLKSNGIDAYNGGGWSSLIGKLENEK